MDDTANQERRASIRYFFSQPAPCAAEEESLSTWEAQVRDLSRTGIGLFSPKAVFPGRLLRIDLKNQTLAARVIHAAAINEGCVLGCALLWKLEDSEVKNLVGDGPLGGNGADQAN